LKNWDKEQGDHLKHLLKQHRPGKSIRSIASEAGINHSNLSRALRGELSPSENMLKSLAFIGIPVPVKNRGITVFSCSI
jgi:DNA-binding phage protein